MMASSITSSTTATSLTPSSSSALSINTLGGSVTPSVNNLSVNSSNMNILTCGTNNNQQQHIGDDRKTISPTVTTTVCNNNIEQQCRVLEAENQILKETQSQLQQQCADAQRRERILMRRFTNKEQEFQDYVNQITEYKAAQAPGPAALRSALLDPAVNLLFEKLKKELQATKAKLEETQNELSAWKFTPDSNTGKRLMAKCRLLYQENEELGKMTSNGRLAKLEGELAMQKSFSEEVKKSQSELDDFLQELDEDVEGMQSTILYLQQELKTTKERIQYLEKENYQLKIGINNVSNDNNVNSSNLNNFNTKNVDCGENALHYINGKNDDDEKWKTATPSETIENLNDERTTTNKNNVNFNLYNKNINVSSCDNISSDNNKINPTKNIISNNINCNDLLKTNEHQSIINGSINNVDNNKNNNFSIENQKINYDLEQCNDSVENSMNNKTNLTTKFNSRKRNHEESDSSDESNICNTIDNNLQSENLTISNSNNSCIGAGVINSNNNSMQSTKLKYNKKLKIKKSRRSSQLTVEICGEDDGVSSITSTNASASLTSTQTMTTNNITQEGSNNSDIEDNNISIGCGDGQTIVTRRKSARNHQNGD